jgi:hypothetical protein
MGIDVFDELVSKALSWSVLGQAFVLHPCFRLHPPAGFTLLFSAQAGGPGAFVLDAPAFVA